MMRGSLKNSTSDMSLGIIGFEQAETIPGLFRQRVANTPDIAAYQQYHEDEEAWKSYTWKQMAGLVARWKMSLEQEGLDAADRVAVLLPNSVEWVCFDQAALALGLVVVPLYPSDTPDNIAFILEDIGARLLLTSQEQWQNLSAKQTHLPELQRVLCLDGNVDVEPAESLLSAVSEWLVKSPARELSCSANPDDLATIIYTSGTTGRPKGVMLSHRNILWNANAILEVIPSGPDDIFLSFLPLSHSFERTVGYYLPMMAGSCVAYARSTLLLAEDLLTIRPTVLVSVPRIYERVYGKIHKKMEQEGRLAQWLFQQAIAIGWRRFEAEQGTGPALTPGQRLLWPLLQGLVAKKIMARLGGRVRVAVSGGAPLTEIIARFFIGLGLPLLQGYGLTEASPVVSTNLLENNLPAGVGPPLPDVEIKLDDGSELVIRSPGVMLGYWKQEEATGALIDQDGWLHTGDVAGLVNNHIHIRGRIKEIIVMSTGKKAPPTDLELAITLDPLFKQVMVVGEGRPFLGALLVLNQDAWSMLADSLELPSGDSASLEASVAHEAILERIAGLLREFPSHAQVHGVQLTLDPWTIQNGMITPTMKLKRAVIEKKSVEKIRRLYAGHV